MGKLLERIYLIVEEKAGIPGRIKLAQETGLPQQQAASIRDKADLVRRSKKAATKILGQEIDDLLREP
jgi:hypothetical protein